MRSKAAEKKLRDVWEKTNGHCHFCGDPVPFEKYGSDGGDECWELDHIIQKAKGGSKSFENCLAACNKCNGLRWHRTGEDIRRLLMLGIIAQKEINKASSLGKSLEKLHELREAQNELRRKRKVATRQSEVVAEDNIVE